MVWNCLWAIGLSLRMAKKNYRNFEFHSSLSSVLDFPCDVHKTKIYHFENLKSIFSAQASPDPHVIRKMTSFGSKIFFCNLTWENYFRSHSKFLLGGAPLYPMLLQRSVCSKQFYARVYEMRGTASYLGLNFCALGAYGPPATPSW